MKKLMCFIVVLALAPAGYSLDSVIGDFEGNVYFWDNSWQLLNGAFNKDNGGTAQISTTIGVTLNNSSMILSNDGTQSAGAQPTIQRGSDGGHGTAYDAGGTFGNGDLVNYVSLSLDVTFVASEWGSPTTVMFGKNLTVFSNGPGGTQSFLANDDVNPSNPGVMIGTGTETHHLTYDFSSYDSTGTTGNASLTWDSDIGGNTVGNIGNFYIDNVVLSSEPPPLIETDQASNPFPADKQTDVLRDVVLRWSPGDFTDKHDVYLGTNFDAVNDATATGDPSGVYMNRQDTNIYPFGGTIRLEFGQTYYWRIDQVSAPPDNTIYKGNIWQFTVEPLAYQIPGQNISASASSGDPDKGPENTINGSGLDETGLLHGNISVDTMWLSSQIGGQPTWIEYEFDKVYKLHQMWVWNFNDSLEPVVGFGFKDVTIEYSVNGLEYTTLESSHEFARAPGSPNYAHNTTVDFNGAPVKYIRLTANSNWEGIFNQFGLSEVRFFHIPVQASESRPESGATDVNVNVTLNWRAGRDAAEYNLYFSDDELAVIDGTAPVTTLSQTIYGPMSLDLGKTYYWRVDEVNNANPDSLWQGNIWNFTTIEFIIIDDMESYNGINEGEPDSNRIYLAWLDGYDNPAINGSTVGHLDPPFVEQTIVHSDRQSMPFAYDNGVGKSEATLTLTSNRDWTVNGVSTLTIWYIGDLANAAEPMYVVLNGSAGLDNPNPNAAQSTDWTEWTISLQDFGINLNNVNTITLGLGNKNNPTAGGSGMMYFDDIRLSAP